MGSGNTLPSAFCCKDNPCGVVVGKLTTCCSEEDVVVNVCLVPELLCNLSKKQELIYVGTIDGYVEEESCFTLTCQTIDYVCGEDDLPADADSGNCCPVDTGVTYVPWAVAKENLSESTAKSCVTCCDDIGDPDPCGPFGSQMSMNYFYKAFVTRGIRHFDDGQSCPTQGPFMRGVAGPPSFNAHPELNNTSCCSDFTCGVTFDVGGLVTQAMDPVPWEQCADCECNYNTGFVDPDFCAPHIGPIYNTFENYKASCSIPRTQCSFDDSSGTGWAQYQGPGELIVSEFTGEIRQTSVTCTTSGMTQVVDYMRSRIVPGPAVQGIWSGRMEWTGQGFTVAEISFEADDASTPEGEDAYFNATLIWRDGYSSSLTEAWDPVGDDPLGNNADWTYEVFENCGNTYLTGLLYFPSSTNASSYFLSGPSSFTRSIIGPSATPYTTNTWDSFRAQQWFGVPEACCEWAGSGGQTFALSIDT